MSSVNNPTRIAARVPIAASTGTYDRRSRERVVRHACGEWLREGAPCHVCSLGVCSCPHPSEWHGRFGCRGWSAPAGECPMPCRCRSEVGRDS